MRIRAATGTTKSGEAYVALYDGPEDDRLILKAYPSPDGRYVRVVLPELANYAQTLIRPEKRIVDFERDAAAAQRAVRR